MHLDQSPDGVRTYRITKGLTQRALAEKLGVSDQTIANWESGRLYPGRMVFLALIGLEMLESAVSLTGDNQDEAVQK